MTNVKEYYIVTGANAGIGRAVMELLAEQGRAIIMACRNIEVATAVRDEIAQSTGNQSIEVWHLDLISLASIHSFVERAKSEGIKIAALINNAGMIAKSFKLADSGLESTMATNYLGTVALTLGLLPLMGQESTITNTLSLSIGAVRPTRKILTPNPNNFNKLGQYALSKLALLYFTAKLAHDNSNVRVVATDPGIVGTNIMHFDKWFDGIVRTLFIPFTRRPRTAAKITLRALADNRTATIYSGSHTARPLNPKLATSLYGEWLWNETRKLI